MTQTTTLKEEMNGVDVPRLKGLIEHVIGDPKQAQLRFKVNNKWSSGSANQSAIQNFDAAGLPAENRQVSFVLNSDEPEMLLGTDKAPNPGEFLLHALAACMTTSLAYHAAAQGIKVKRIESVLDGDMDMRGFTGLVPNVRPGYQNIRVKFNVESDAPADQLKELLKLSPMFDTISKPVAIDVQLTTV